MYNVLTVSSLFRISWLAGGFISKWYLQQGNQESGLHHALSTHNIIINTGLMIGTDLSATWPGVCLNKLLSEMIM